MGWHVHQLDVCSDCVDFLAQGQEADSKHESKVLAEWPAPWFLTLGGSECETCQDQEGHGYACESWFARSPCDMCGVWLAGARHHATASQFLTDLEELANVADSWREP